MSYQAVYDAAFRQFDISHYTSRLYSEFHIAAMEMQRPSVLFRPTLSADGSMWCALLGDDLMSGIAGFGETPALAMEAFDKAFLTERTPAAQRAARVPEVVGEVG